MSVRMIVCDDSVFARRTLIKALPADWDIEVHEAKGGSEALSLCRDGKKPDLMFLDLNMPEVSGLDVLTTLHQEGFTFPIVVVSANFQDGMQQRVKSLGARLFLRKPIASEDVTRLLDYLRKEGSV